MGGIPEHDDLVLLSWWMRCITHVRDMLAALVLRAAAETPGGDLLNAFDYGNEVASRIFGRPVTGNAGFRYLLMRPVVEGFMDQHRFEAIVENSLPGS